MNNKLLNIIIILSKIIGYQTDTNFIFLWIHEKIAKIQNTKFF